jgi:hypothetical protein
MLLTESYYRAVTGDTSTSTETFASAASSAQELCEDALDRVGMLELGERTETLEVAPAGYLYPTATPLISADGWTVDGYALRGGSSSLTAWVGWLGSDLPATVDATYVGGYTTATAPEYLLRDLAFATYALCHPPDLGAMSVIPAGASAVSVGDVSVSFGSGGAPGTMGGLGVSITWSAHTMQLRAVPSP